jgi:hypothetical protein
VRYATSWAFAKAEDGKPYFRPCVLRQLRATDRCVLGVGFLLTNAEVLQAVGEKTGDSDFGDSALVHWVACCAEQSGSLADANLRYLRSSHGCLISIRDAVCEVSEEVARAVLELSEIAQIAARRALREVPETLAFLAPPMIHRSKRFARVFCPQVLEEARTSFRSVLRALAEGDCSAFLRAEEHFYSTAIQDAHEYVLRAFDAAFASGLVFCCAHVMEDEIPVRFAAYLSRALEALEVFASYDLHPDIVFQSNYARIPVTAEERQAAEQASKEAFEGARQRSLDENASTTPDGGYSGGWDLEPCLGPWADFEQSGFETVDDVLASAFIEKRDATGTGGVIGHVSREAAQPLSFLVQVLSRAVVDSDDGRPAWNALQRILRAGGWTAPHLLQRVRTLALQYGKWAARIDPLIGLEGDISRLEQEFARAELLLPSYEPAPSGGYLIVCSTGDELMLERAAM